MTKQMILESPSLIDRLVRGTNEWSLIDVRAPSEWDKASITGFVNLPILNDSERHLVGLAYKHHGQDAAIKLALELTAPHQQSRIDGWYQAVQSSPVKIGVVMCWRGGLRSLTACQRLAEAGAVTMQLAGGYKAIRNELLKHLVAPPSCIVLTGLTGSGKTSLIRQLNGSETGVTRAIDLELSAGHRGSAFGAGDFESQPSQSRFENNLALQIIRGSLASSELLIEDESRTIGNVSVPDALYKVIVSAPVVVVDEPLHVRSANIAQEYLQVPLDRGVPLEALHEKAKLALTSISRRLDVFGPKLSEQMDSAFKHGGDLQRHQEWIEALLVHYYDKSYYHSLNRLKRPTLFQGDRLSCQAWLEDYFAKKSMPFAV